MVSAVHTGQPDSPLRRHIVGAWESRPTTHSGRLREAGMRTTAVALSAMALLAAGCGSQQAAQQAAHRAAPQAAPRPPAGADTSAAARLVSVASTTSPTRCRVSSLSLRLGRADHAAGSTYRPIIFTNTGGAACTLRGYPGVSYVAPTTGRQVGAAAGRDDAEPTRTITLAPGGHAAALLQLVIPFNSPAADCVAKTVSGLRVYPPGSTAAAYVAFARHHRACSSNVHQLSVRAVLRGTTGA